MTRYQVEFLILVGPLDGCANKDEALIAAQEHVQMGCGDYVDLDDPIAITEVDEEGDPIT